MNFSRSCWLTFVAVFAIVICFSLGSPVEDTKDESTENRFLAPEQQSEILAGETANDPAGTTTSEPESGAASKNSPADDITLNSELVGKPTFPLGPEDDVVFNLTETREIPPLNIEQYPELKVSENATIIGSRAACQCGKPPGRIVGGGPALIQQYPWTVALVRDSWLGLTNKPFCGGTLINDRYVVTASHCVDNQYPSGIRVWLNTEDISNSKGRIVAEVSEIKMHPDYSRRTVDNDIALVKLKNPIDFNSETILAPACIPANNDNDFSKYEATVAGWGTTSSGGSTSKFLRKVVVPIITNEVCNRDTKYQDKISNNMLCAGYPEGGKDACQGDSGGPLVLLNGDRQTLVGVVSWGYGCAGPNAPGVYCRVSRYPQWILDNTRGAQWCAE